MRFEQQQRYLEDIAAEEERVYTLGSLSATSGRVLSIALHAGPIPGLEFPGLGPESSEYVFGIDQYGYEQEEKQALQDFLTLMKDFDPDCDELVGHNIIGFDLPFVFQRCLAHSLHARPFVNLSEYIGGGWARNGSSVSTTSRGRSALSRARRQTSRAAKCLTSTRPASSI
jgi:hypothetical protein